MISFSLTDTAPYDLRIEDNAIQMARDEALLAEKLQAVWSTNRGEWSLNPREGVRFSEILRKNPDEDSIRLELEEALEAVDREAELADFSLHVDSASRRAVIMATVRAHGKDFDVPLEVEGGE